MIMILLCASLSRYVLTEKVKCLLHQVLKQHARSHSPAVLFPLEKQAVMLVSGCSKIQFSFIYKSLPCGLQS